MSLPLPPLNRSLTAPEGTDCAIETEPEQKEHASLFAHQEEVEEEGVAQTGGDAAAADESKSDPCNVGRAHQVHHAHASAPIEPQTPAFEPGTDAKAPASSERRPSKGNLRLADKAPPKLSAASASTLPSSSTATRHHPTDPVSATAGTGTVMSVPREALLVPPSPVTPALFHGPPPNTPATGSLSGPGAADAGRMGSSASFASGLSALSLSNVGEDEVASPGNPSPLYDQPFTPLPVPPSPMLPRPPPPSPFVGSSVNSKTSMSPLPSPTFRPSPSASPHPPRLYMTLPATMSGIDVLSPVQRMAVREEANETEAGQAEGESESDPQTEAAGEKQDDTMATLVETEVKPDETVEEAASSSSSIDIAKETEEQQEQDKAKAKNSESNFEQATPSLPVEDEGAQSGGEQLSPRDASNVVEVEVPVPLASPTAGSSSSSSSSSSSPSLSPAELPRETILLSRSKLGRLSIIQRKDLPKLLSSSSKSTGRQSSPSPTAVDIDTLTPDELVKHSTPGPIVTRVDRIQHVTFDPNASPDAVRESVPPEWRDALQSHFGLPPTLYQTTKVSGYVARIPTILVKLGEYLRASDAFATNVGIFRLAPDQAACANLKSKLQTNLAHFDEAIREVGGEDAPNCVANLIKIWFRELPASLFQPIPIEDVSHLSSSRTTDAQLEQTITKHLKEPQQSIFRWLLDLLADVTLHCKKNMMPAKNLAICISPNLYQPPGMKSPHGSLKGPAGGGAATGQHGHGAHGSMGSSGDMQATAEQAVKAMHDAKNFSNFLELCIGMREEQRGQPRTSCV